jgi:hypothetical protein
VASAGPAASSGEGAPPASDPIEPGLTPYRMGMRHSPLTARVVRSLRERLDPSTGRREVFAKVGDSITISGHFLHCLAGSDLRWGAHEGLAATRDFFAKTAVDGDRNSFTRTTEAAHVGWPTKRLLEGVPPFVDREISAIKPAFAVVLLGTNETYEGSAGQYDLFLRRLIDRMTERGVVPLLSTIPPRRDGQRGRPFVEEMNAVVTALAWSRQLPIMDLSGALEPLPHAGLNRDGVHPEAYRDASPHPCWFDEAGLTGGMNQRNLLVLEALDRVRRVVLGREPPEPEPAAPEGAGTWESPAEVRSLPYLDVRDGRGGDERAGRYEGCGSEVLDGPERVYRVTLDHPEKLIVRVMPEPGVEVALRWLSSPEPASCTHKGSRRLVVQAATGVHWLAVDSSKSPGSYRLAVLRAPGGS